VTGELLALLGSILVLLAAIGVQRFGDTLARMHALAKASTLGVLLLLTGAAINAHNANDITSIALAAVLHLLATPPSSNMVSRAIYRAYGMPGARGTIDEGAELHRRTAGA
jgi:multicomponent Na+:H+ antiporter subunit G